MINGEIFATVFDLLGLIQVEEDGHALEKVGSWCLPLRARSKVSNIPFCFFFFSFFGVIRRATGKTRLV